VGFIEQWDDLLGQMNAGKRGRPFRCPEPFIAWMACIHVFLQMPYRQMEGFVWTLATFIPSLRAANYTTLFRRIQRRDLSLTVTPELLAEDIIIAVDSTGIKVANWGEWLRERWRVQRGWNKVHAMIDVETNQILGLEVTDESVQVDWMLVPLLDQVQQHCGEERPVHRVLGDGTYDRNEIFATLEHRNILSGIKTRANAATHSTGAPYRAECVRDRIRVGGYQLWSWITPCGMRWKIEGTFSSLKRIFGEGVRATSREGMFREIRMKVNAYNMLIAMVA